jgi:hypothetical protein
MKPKSFFIKAATVIVMALGLVTAAIADNTTTKNSATQSQIPAKKNIHVLFTQIAPSATLTPQADKDWYTLTLANVNPDVLWFTNRPNRMSGDVAMADFVKYWKEPTDNKNFVKDHPNADLIGVSGNTKVRGVFMLSKPNYDPQQQTLTYRVYHIAGAGNFNDTITSLQHVALFIDNADCPWCP